MIVTRLVDSTSVKTRQSRVVLPSAPIIKTQPPLPAALPKNQPPLPATPPKNQPSPPPRSPPPPPPPPMYRPLPDTLTEDVKHDTTTIQRIEPTDNKSIVIIPYYNYVKSHRIYSNLYECVHSLQNQGIPVLVVEVRLPTQKSHILDLSCNILSVVSETIAFHNHTAFNIGFREIQHVYEYVVQCDGDILFDDPEWILKTEAVLQDHDIVMPWSSIQRLNKYKTSFRKHTSFTSWLVQNPTITMEEYYKSHYGGGGSPGFVWAYRTDFLQRIGGLFNRAFLGSGDTTNTYLAYGPQSLTLSTDDRLRSALKYLRPDLDEWLECVTTPAPRVGSQEGTIRHLVHGKLANRQYMSRHMNNLNEGSLITDFLEPGGPFDPVVFRDPTKNERVLSYLKARKDDEVD